MTPNNWACVKKTTGRHVEVERKNYHRQLESKEKAAEMRFVRDLLRLVEGVRGERHPKSVCDFAI